LLDEGAQAAAVGHGAVEHEVHVAGLEGLQITAQQRDGGYGFVDASIGAVHAGEIAQAAVATAEHDAAAKGYFQSQQNVEAVDPELAVSLQALELGLPESHGSVGAAGAHHCVPLTLVERVAVADEFERR